MNAHPFCTIPIQADNYVCEDCDSSTKVSIEPYGTGKMAVYNCPNCGESYDTNYDGAGL